MGRSEDTKKRIYDAIFDLMAQTPVDKIPVDAVACAAGISRSSFYRYFSSVNDAVKEYEDGLVAVLTRINDLSLKIRFTALDAEGTHSLVEAFTVVSENREKIRALNGANGDPAFQRKVDRIIERTLREHVPDRLKSRVGDYDLYVAYSVAGHNAAVNRWLVEASDLNPIGFAADLSRMLYAPLLLGENETFPRGLS